MGGLITIIGKKQLRKLDCKKNNKNNKIFAIIVKNDDEDDIKINKISKSIDSKLLTNFNVTKYIKISVKFYFYYINYNKLYDVLFQNTNMVLIRNVHTKKILTKFYSVYSNDNLMYILLNHIVKKYHVNNIEENNANQYNKNQYFKCKYDRNPDYNQNENEIEDEYDIEDDYLDNSTDIIIKNFNIKNNIDFNNIADIGIIIINQLSEIQQFLILNIELCKITNPDNNSIINISNFKILYIKLCKNIVILFDYLNKFIKYLNNYDPRLIVQFQLNNLDSK